MTKKKEHNRLVVALAKCQRGRDKHGKNRKAVQSLRTGALILFIKKPSPFPFHCVQIMVTSRRRKVLF